jgi:hypothetical protein
MPARYAAQIEEVCNRYEEPLLRLEPDVLPFCRPALESGKRLRSRFFVRAKSVPLSAGVPGKAHLQALEELFYKVNVANTAVAAGPGPGHQATTAGDPAEESEALSQYESMRHQVGIVRCGL